MNEQVLVYEVKSSANANADKLFSDDRKYFYWNDTAFKNLEIGDFVIVVNTHARQVLFSKLDKINIPVTLKDEKTIFNDSNKDFEVSGKWNKFIRLKIIGEYLTPESWQWKSLGSSEITYLSGERINAEKSENRILNINELKQLSSEDLYTEILNNCLLNFDQSTPQEHKVWFVTQGNTYTPERGMKFLWAPAKGKDDKPRLYWDNVLKVKKGDIIFNYSEGLKGVSIASTDGYASDNDDETSPWGPEGNKVEIDLTQIAPFIAGTELATRKTEFASYLKNISNKPFNINGGVNQGYVYEFTKEAGRFIRDLYGKKFGNKIIDDFFDKVLLNQPLITGNEMEYIAILNAIKTKPFILLAGISGTGKSRLVRTLAYKTCDKPELQINTKKPGNFELIPVRPNWHDSSELMGYISRINGEKYITTSFLQFIAKAWKNIVVPFFLCLDEMNLAPVEQYFAEYLSIIETRQVHNDEIWTDYLLSKSSFENHDLYTQVLKELGLDNDNRFDDGLSIPKNLIVIGTVNMDETTHSFSRKVLDRAMTFEMNEIDLNAGLDNSRNDWSYHQSFVSSSEVIGEFTAGREVVSKFDESKKVIEFLQKVNNELEGTPFKIAYRVRDEFLIYCHYSSLDKTDPNWLNMALDDMVSMKILSRIEGDETKTGGVLRNLQKILTADFKKSNLKLKEMETRLQNSGYTSFWT